MDEFIVSEMTKEKFINAKYPEYFQPEIKAMFNDELRQKYEQNELKEGSNDYDLIKKIDEEVPDNFDEKRKMGENDEEICQIIRNDLIEEFIIYINKNNYQLNNSIVLSIFETNPFLLKHDNISLIEYAAFFGSIQIFKYLYKNNIELKSKLWIYAIHGDDSEMIHILEENNVPQPFFSYEESVKESIKCHHNHITNYIRNKMIEENNDNMESIDFNHNFDENMIAYVFHYYDFQFFPTDLSNKYYFYYACKFDYLEIVEFYLKERKIDLNEKVIAS